VKTAKLLREARKGSAIHFGCLVTAIVVFILIGSRSMPAAQAQANSSNSNSESDQQSKPQQHAAKRTSELPGAVPGSSMWGRNVQGLSR
jgi:hypothetical protein